MESIPYSKFIEYKNWVERTQNILKEEFAISDAEKVRISSFTPPEGQTPEKMWCEFALRIKAHLLEDYKDGEIEFSEMLSIMRKCSLGLPEDLRLFFLGTVAEFGLKTSHSVKERLPGQRKAINPRWLKRVIVELFDTIKEKYPDLNKFSYYNKNDEDSVYKLIINLLSPLQIVDFLSERTIERWVGEPRESISQPDQNDAALN